MNSFTQVLDSLPKKFSSHDFLMVARRNKLMKAEEKISTKREVFVFLSENAHQESTKTWVKKDLNQDNASETEQEKKEDFGYQIQKAIEVLKNNGYRILKPVTDYQEI